MLLLENMIGRESTGKEWGLKRLDHNRTDYEIGWLLWTGYVGYENWA